MYMDKPKKLALVFDMDETLGYFTQIAIFIDWIEMFITNPSNKKEKKLTNEQIFELFDLFPEIFRPGVFHTIDFIKKQKKKKPYLRLMIYTNNMGPKSWAHIVRKYIEKKMGQKLLFDRTICAWKVGNLQYEKCRTTHMKTYEDLKKCGNLGDNDKICFFDDAFHPLMEHSNVDYHRNNKYKTFIPTSLFLSRLSETEKVKGLIKNFNAFRDYALKKSREKWYISEDNKNNNKMKYSKLDFLRKVRSFIKENKLKLSKKRKKKRLNKTKKKLMT